MPKNERTNDVDKVRKKAFVLLTNAKASNFSSFVNELCSIVTSRRKRLEKNRSSDVKWSQLLSKQVIWWKMNRNFLFDSIDRSLPQSLVKITRIDIIVLQPSRKTIDVSDALTVVLDAVVDCSEDDEVTCCLNQTSDKSSNLQILMKNQRFILRFFFKLLW